MKPALTAERLRDLLDYDPTTGAFRWRVRLQNRLAVGQIAGARHHRGGVNIRIDGRVYLAHRLAWLHVHGGWPPGVIDHRDLNKANNALSNLRSATPPQNNANVRALKGKLVPLKGVTLHKRSGKFQAAIKVGGKSLYLGLHRTPEEAHAAYVAAASKHFGEFARAA